MQIEKVSARLKDVGGIPVARLIPQSGRRTIGAWCFLDHAGPAVFGSDSDGMQVGAHPHTNLQTFTWMLQGEMWHQDSLGCKQLIRPGQVNLMTAGTGDTRGISHTEQTPEGVKHLHAVQLWIALPLNQEIEPSFEHYPQLPAWTENGADYILTTGSYGGYTAPTRQYSPLLGLDMRLKASSEKAVTLNSGWEYGILVISGSFKTNGQVFAENELAFIEPNGASSLLLSAETDCHVMLLGGEPLPHPTLIWWNFVADSRESLCLAVEDWNQGHSRFGHIDLAGTGLKRLPAPSVPAKIR